MTDNGVKINQALESAQEQLFTTFDRIVRDRGLSYDEFFPFVKAWFADDVRDCYREWILEGAE